MIDFTQSKFLPDIPKTSYVPGTTSVDGSSFPGFLTQILREGFTGKSMRGYLQMKQSYMRQSRGLFPFVFLEIL
jgi:hypothetical protein